jgi:acyl-CoA synthetase (AMP-forming)/AMP-acid ligase II
MTSLLHELTDLSALSTPNAIAIRHRQETYKYSTFQTAINQFSYALIDLGANRQERVAIFLPKQYETAVSIFGTVAAGCVFVPVNPILKPPQVEHIPVSYTHLRAHET